jgi:HEAT repeat protein
VRKDALSMLGAMIAHGAVDAATLATHLSTIVARLDDEESDVVEEAVKTLHKLDAATLSTVVPLVVPLLDGDRDWAALMVLGNMDMATLAPLVPRVIAKLNSRYEDAREAAEKALQQLDAGTLEPHASAIVALFAQEDHWVRWAAVNTLLGMKADALSPIFPMLVSQLKASDALVREMASETLSGLSASQLRVDTIIAALDDSDAFVRQIAVEMLGNLQDAAHADRIVAKLEEEDLGVRCQAIHALRKADALTLATHADKVRTSLQHTDADVRLAANWALITHAHDTADAATLEACVHTLISMVEDADHMDFSPGPTLFTPVFTPDASEKSHIACKAIFVLEELHKLGKLDAHEVSLLTRLTRLLASIQAHLAPPEADPSFARSFVRMAHSEFLIIERLQHSLNQSLFLNALSRLNGSNEELKRTAADTLIALDVKALAENPILQPDIQRLLATNFEDLNADLRSVVQAWRPQLEGSVLQSATMSQQDVSEYWGD